MQVKKKSMRDHRLYIFFPGNMQVEGMTKIFLYQKIWMQRARNTVYGAFAFTRHDNHETY